MIYFLLFSLQNGVKYVRPNESALLVLLCNLYTKKLIQHPPEGGNKVSSFPSIIQYCTVYCVQCTYIFIFRNKVVMYTVRNTKRNILKTVKKETLKRGVTEERVVIVDFSMPNHFCSMLLTMKR